MAVTYDYERISGRPNDRPPPGYDEIVGKDPPKKSHPPPPSPRRSKEKFPDGENDFRHVIGMRRSSFLFLLYLVFYVVYLVTGGLIFAMLEGPGEEEVRQSLVGARIRFLEDHSCVEDQALEELIEKIIGANNRGVSALRNASGESNWNFGQSLFFSSTVVTTIGYGHVTPSSKAGKCFCIVYAVLGIPLTLTLMTALIERLTIPSKRFLKFLHGKLDRRWDPTKIRLLHLLCVGFLLFVFFWFIPAVVFAHIERDWDLLDSMYYCFISLTTIGLGDYIPGDSPDQPHRPLYKLLTTGYLLSGLTFLAFTLTVFHDIPQLNFGSFILMQSDETSSFETLDPEKILFHQSSTIYPKYTEDLGETKEKHVHERKKSIYSGYD